MVGSVHGHLRLERDVVDGEAVGRVVAPVVPLPEPDVAEARRPVAPARVDQLPRRKLGHQVAPRHRDLAPFGRLDREAVSVPQCVVRSVDELQPTPVGRTVALRPETDAFSTVPLLRGSHTGREEPARGPVDEREPAGSAQLAGDDLDRPDGLLFLAHRRRPVPNAVHVEDDPGAVGALGGACSQARREHDRTGQCGSRANRDVHGLPPAF